jgi:hypothetical protein
MNRRSFLSRVLAIIAVVYVPSMPLTFEEAMPEPRISEDGGFLVPEPYKTEILAAVDEFVMIVGPHKLVDLGPMTFGNMT